MESYGIRKAPPAPSKTGERLHFRGVFRHEERNEGPFTVVIDAPRTAPSVLSGYVLGTDAEAERLRFPRGELHIESVDRNNDAVVRCSGVRIHQLVFSGPPNHPSNHLGLICEFSAQTVRVEEPLPDWDEGERVYRYLAEFTLAGPTRIWGVWQSNGFGEGPAQFENCDVDVDSPGGEVVRIEPRQVSWSDGAATSTVNVYVLSITRVADAPVPIQAFEASSTALIEDVLAVQSFLAEGRIAWFKRDVYDRDIHLQTRRGRVDWSDTEPAPFSGSPAAQHEREFLRVALSALSYWRECGVDLVRPIEHVLSASYREKGTATQRFSSAFTALENLVSLFATTNDREFTLSEEAFGALAKAVKTTIKEKVDDRRAREALHGKIRDLNRPAFSSVLSACLSHYNLKWTDLYPRGHALTKPDFIEIRHSLFHTGQSTSETRLALETERIRTLVVRILMRMLGWSETHIHYPAYGLEYMRKYWGNET